MAELQATLSAREFAEWLALWRIYPFGDEWRQAALVASAATRFAVAPEKLLPTYEPPPQSVAEAQHLVRLAAAAAARKDQRRGRD